MESGDDAERPQEPTQKPTPHRQEALIRTLQARGVVIPAPAAVVVRDVDPERIEPGVVIHPGTTLCGEQTCLGRDTHLGRAGGGWFENVRTGRQVELYGGYVQDAVFLDGVVVRGHAEMRAGTLMEEESEAAHHVGYKQTITMPWVIAGSLVNFCDALVAGGTSRKDHSEIGSTMALYNFTPRGDKLASLFGDVPRGVFLREPRIFVGGQTQIVSPVHVGFGAVLAAGAGVRKAVGEGQLFGEPPPDVSRPFDAERYGPVAWLFRSTIGYVANLWALDVWYARVRIPGVSSPDYEDAHAARLYAAARAQVRAGIAERIKRLGRLVDKLPRSVERHRRDLVSGDPEHALPSDRVRRWHEERVREQEALVAAWPRLQEALQAEPAAAREGFPGSLGTRFAVHNASMGRTDYLGFVQHVLEPEDVSRGRAALQAVVGAVIHQAALPELPGERDSAE
jgi:UDP-N-acetylglucosamine/UDP-N-acetylgalactosamine diphosphorylase